MKLKASKKAFFIAIAIIAASVIAVILLFVLGSGNFKTNSKRLGLKDSEEMFEDLNINTASSGMAEEFREKCEIQIKEIKWSGEAGVAEVVIYTPDLSKIISDAVSHAIESGDTKTYDDMIEEAEKYIEDTLVSDTCPISEYDINMEAKKSGESYTLVSSDEFERIISGNVEEIFFNAVTEGIENA